MPFQIIRNDITKVKADAIVNTANPYPVIGGGTDSAIYKAAGEEQLLNARLKIGMIECGEIAVTPAFDLDAKYIIHTVGPVWEGGNKGELEALKSCYANSLDKALELQCESIAFPMISTGVYGFPKDQALQIAMQEISAFLMREDTEMMVSLVVFDDKAFRLSRNLFFQVESFIDDADVLNAHLEEYGMSKDEFDQRRERNNKNRLRKSQADAPDNTNIDNYDDAPGVLDFSDECELPPILFNECELPTIPFNEHTFDKNQFMNDGKQETSFVDCLIRLLNEKDIDNKTAYGRSNISKGAFSKILCGDTKTPKKKAVLGFCIGLELDHEEAVSLMASANLAFNPADKRDQLVLQCIKNGQYNISEVNEMLYICDQPLLGSDWKNTEKD